MPGILTGMPYIPFDEHGLLLRRTAVNLGYDDVWLWRMVRCGALIRIRQGAYADPLVWLSLTRFQQHLLLSRAVMQQYDDRVALSHASAHLMRGGPNWGLNVGSVNITNLFGRGDRTQAGITHHHGVTRVGDVSRWEDHWITSPARTAVETAAAADPDPAVCVLDWTLNENLATREQLELYAAVHMREWPGSIGLPLAVSQCDGRSESVGEARTRLIFRANGFDPEPQWHVYRASGRLAGRVDLLLRELGLMVEFDGQIKYGRLLKPGQTIKDVIKAERDREIVLEELTGLRMFRVVWSDLNDPKHLIDRAMRAAAVRRAG